MKKLFLSCCLLAVAATGLAQEPCPRVIPAIQEWKGGKGTIALPAKGFITIRPEDRNSLEATARTLSDDLKELMGWDYAVRFGKPAKGDICLAFWTTPSKAFLPESYNLTVSNRVVIEGETSQGVFWGTRTLLQMLCNEKGTLPRGVAMDGPIYKSRGFMLDVGRKFFTMDYLRQLVKVLSFYKMNELQVHLNDNGFPQFFGNDWNRTYSAFRLESTRFPGLTAKDGSYTKREFTDLQRLGMQYGVNVIPEIDIPAHSLAFTHYKPEIASEEYGFDHLDLYKEETYRFVDTLLDEYLGGESPVFIGPDLHIGTDEYNKKEAERFRYFTDRYLKFVESYGKRPRMWGGLKWLDGKTPVKSEGVIVNAWTYDWIDPVRSLEEGYRLINTCDTYLYIVPAAGYYRDFLDRKWLYQEWTPGKLNHKQTLPDSTPGLLGAMFAVWNDKCGNGISQQDVHYRFMPAVQVLSEKLWKGTNPDVAYEEFEELCRRMPEAPGINLLAKVPAHTQLTAEGEELSLNGANEIPTSLKEAGYPYAVSFDICPDTVDNNSGVLFKGPHSTLYTNWENTGRIAFSRDGYTFSFPSYRLPKGEWTSIRIEGDYKGTSLYVNGRLQERLEGRTMKAYNSARNRMDEMAYQETLIFPLEKMGDSRNGFRGKIRNVVCRQGER